MSGDQRRRSAFVLFVLLVTAAAIYRLPFSIDFEDEGFYVGLAHSFAIGSKPFVDELDPHQTAALFVGPIVKAYLSWTGGSDGLFLFVRWLSLALMSLVGLAAASLASSEGLDGWTASVGLAACLAYFPFMLSSLSYNLLGSTFAAFTFVIATDRRTSMNYFLIFCAWASAIVSSVSYPTFVICNGLALLFGIFGTGALSTPRTGARRILALHCGALLVATLVFGVLLFSQIHMRDILASIQFYHEIQPALTLANRTHLLTQQLRQFLPGLLVIVLAASVLAGLGLRAKAQVKESSERRAREMKVFGFSTLVAGGAIFIHDAFTLGIWCLGCSPLLLAGHRGRYFEVWIFSLLAAILSCCTSNNGLRNCFIGFAPGFVISLLYAASILRSALSSKVFVHLSWFFLAVLIGKFMYLQYTDVYGLDGPGSISRLNARVESGPFKGLYTTPEKRKFVGEFATDLETWAPHLKTILIYDQFPAGYVFTTLRPLSPCIWINSPDAQPTLSREVFVKYYQDPAHRPDLVVELDSADAVAHPREHRDLTNPGKDLFRYYFRTLGYELVKINKEYLIWRKPRSGQPGGR